MCGGFFNNPVQSMSDTVSHVGKVVASSPIAQSAITIGGALLGVPPMVTAGLLGANSAGQAGDIGAGLRAGVGSYALASRMGASGATGAGAAGTYVPGAAAGEAGYTLTGDAIADASVLKDMGYTGSQIPGLLATGTGASGIFNNIGGGIMNGIGGMMNANTNTNIANTQADAQIRAAQIAADAAKFKPVGVTTNFGQSDFAYDANGNLVAAGYKLNPTLQGQQNQIMNASGGLLNQYLGAQAATAPMGTAAQRAMTLGNQYLATDPQAQAQKYLADQQGLLAPGRAQDFAALQAQNAAQGRSGFAMGGGVNGQMAANPEMQAYWNARMQQDAQLAANATQGGMDYAKFGIGTVGSGGDMLSSMYKTQTNAASPYTTALGTANTIEGMGQNAMDLGTSIGARTSTANAKAGQYLSQGMLSAAQTQANAAQQNGNPWADILTGAAGNPAVQNAVGGALQSGWNWLENYAFGS